MRQNNKTREAMAYAMANPANSQQHGRQWWETPRDKKGFGHGLLWKCRVVLNYSRELAQQVLDGSIALHAAFNEAHPPTPRPPRERRPPRPTWQAPKKPSSRPIARR
jgi:hypothetical protein